MSILSKEAVLWTLSHHIGAAQGIHARDLVIRIVGVQSAAAERDLRALIERLRRDGYHVCGTPSRGYHMAANADELLATCQFLYARAMTSLSQVAAMQRVSLPDLRAQLRLPLEPCPQAVCLSRPDQPAVSVNNTGSQSPAANTSSGGDLAADVDVRDGQ